MRACGQKLVKFCTHTHTRGKISSRDIYIQSALVITRRSESNRVICCNVCSQGKLAMNAHVAS